MKHNADTLRNVILSCDSIRDARNLSHVSSDCCHRASRASLTAREAPCTHVCHMRVHSAKHRVPTALIIMKGPRATTHHRLLTPRPARLVWYSSDDTSPGSTRTMLPGSRHDRLIRHFALPPAIACACSPNSCMPLHVTSIMHVSREFMQLGNVCPEQMHTLAPQHGARQTKLRRHPHL